MLSWMGNWSESLGNPSSIKRRISYIRDTQEKGGRITSIFTSVSSFLGLLPFGVPLTWLWAVLYLSCPSASVSSSTWSDAHTLSIISSFTPYLPSPTLLPLSNHKSVLHDCDLFLFHMGMSMHACLVVSDSLWLHGLQPARLLCP